MASNLIHVIGCTFQAGASFYELFHISDDQTGLSGCFMLHLFTLPYVRPLLRQRN
jgi:hypothetical protein